MVLLPLLVMTLMDFGLTRRVIEDEVKTGMVLTVTTIAHALQPDAVPDVMDAQGWLQVIKRLSPGPDNDIFVMDAQKKLITPSIHIGPPGSILPFSEPDAAQSGIDIRMLAGQDMLVAFARPDNAAITVVQIKPETAVTELWLSPRLKLTAYLGFSILLIIISIIAMATYLVERIHRANRHWLDALHHEEHATRLASIGRLASGVAHEINNPLEIINQKTGLMLDLLRLGKADQDRLEPLAADIIVSVRRCSTITRQLLDFARHMEPCIAPVDIHEILDQILPLLKADAEQRGIKIRVDHPQDIPLIQCDRSSLQQIFLNLAENAITAMDKGGNLDIRIRPHSEEEITIIVSDTGRGISEADQKKIFEPFYSTKEEGWGAGLGLAITYGLTKEMGGDIRVKSRLNKGSEFTLTLPLQASLPEDPGSLHLPGHGDTQPAAKELEKEDPQ